jgi:hypothetical protein
MPTCNETFAYYLLEQEIIKKNMSKLSKECPDKVLKFLLQGESTTTISKLVDCTWADHSDKKHISKILKKTCEALL